MTGRFGVDWIIAVLHPILFSLSTGQAVSTKKKIKSVHLSIVCGAAAEFVIFAVCVFTAPVWWRCGDQALSTDAVFAGKPWSFGNTAPQWPESELPDRPEASLWRGLVLPLYVSPPVGQRGALLGAKTRGRARSDALLPTLSPGAAPWHTALAWGQ